MKSSAISFLKLEKGIAVADSNHLPTILFPISIICFLEIFNIELALEADKSLSLILYRFLESGSSFLDAVTWHQ